MALTKQQQAELIHLYSEQRWGYTKLARRFKLSRITIRKHLMKAGVYRGELSAADWLAQDRARNATYHKRRQNRIGEKDE
jgi:hypothetical protein